jgi:hypothetical protein
VQWTRRSRGLPSGRRFLPREHHVLHRGTFIALQFFGSRVRTQLIHHVIAAANRIVERKTSARLS